MLYLDHAATSFPKPAAVLAAMAHWYQDLGVSAARGSSRRTSEVAAVVARARAGIARMCGHPSERTAFTSGATESSNLFLRAFLRPGDTVLTTAFEHASVARPLTALARQLSLRLVVLPPDADLGLSADTVARALQEVRPRLFAFTHASNVTGTLFDAAAFCALARRHGARTLLDVSQTAGHLPIAVGADAVAGSAHKALRGPPGLGFLTVADDLELAPQKQGGTGSSRALDEHPLAWPAAFEAGTPNTPAIFGLDAALALSPADDLGQALAATAAFAAALAGDAHCRVLPAAPRGIPVLSFVHPQLEPAEVGAVLDQHDVHVRTGHHCAPWLHQHLGTEHAGTVRISPGPDVTADDIRRVSAALVG